MKARGDGRRKVGMTADQAEPIDATETDMDTGRRDATAEAVIAGREGAGAAMGMGHQGASAAVTPQGAPSAAVPTVREKGEQELPGTPIGQDQRTESRIAGGPG